MRSLNSLSIFQLFLRLFILLTTSSLVYANDLVDPSKLGLNVKKPDFSRLAKAIGDKRIVVLDEITHGESNVFALKREVIEYLHQHHGFDVLLLESGIYDVHKIVENAATDGGKTIVAQAPGNIFYIYANHPQTQALFGYIDNNRDSAKPLQLAGFDGRLSGINSQRNLVVQLQSFVSGHYRGFAKAFDWQAFNQTTQAIIDRKVAKYSQVQQGRYLFQSYDLIDLLERSSKGGNGFESSAFWALVLKGVVRVAEQQWQLRRFDENDLVMGQNLKWLIDHVYSNKKILVWGHFIHVNKQGMGPGRYVNAGQMLANAYPNEVYNLHFGGGSGQFTNYIDHSVLPVPPAPANSFERLMLNSPHQLAFIDKTDFDQSLLQQTDLTLFGSDYTQPLRLKDFSQMFDGMMWLRTVKPLDGGVK